MLGLKFDPKYTEAIILTFYGFPKPEKQQIETTQNVRGVNLHSSFNLGCPIYLCS